MTGRSSTSGERPMGVETGAGLNTSGANRNWGADASLGATKTNAIALAFDTAMNNAWTVKTAEPEAAETEASPEDFETAMTTMSAGVTEAAVFQEKVEGKSYDYDTLENWGVRPEVAKILVQVCGKYNVTHRLSAIASLKGVSHENIFKIVDYFCKLSGSLEPVTAIAKEACMHRPDKDGKYDKERLEALNLRIGLITRKARKAAGVS
jgi:hypothetical protein